MSECKHEWSRGKMFYGKSDCPYCEINRLKAELEEYKRCTKWEGCKAVCIDRDAAIAKIKELTAFIAKEVYRADKLVDKIENLERQLAEARTEVDRLTLENRQMSQGMKWDNQLKAIARQEAARTVCSMLKSAVQTTTPLECAKYISKHFELEESYE